MSDNTERPPYDSPFKNRVVGFVNSGRKIREAQRLFGVPKSTVQRWCSKVKKFGNTHRLPGSGRPRKLSDRACRLVVREAVKHRQVCLAALGNSINPNVSSNTVRRLLADAGYHRRSARHKPYLKVEHIKLRLRWAKKYKLWKFNHWQHVIWSDECYVRIGDNKGRVYITRRPEETYDDDCVIWSFKQSNVRVMVWGCIAYNYKSPLVLLEYPGGAGGGMNTQRYIEQVLDSPLADIYQELKGSQRYMYFQQDSATCHTSKKSMEWFKKAKIQLFPHPPNSPDLNPIENLWSILKHRIRSMPHPPTSTEELKCAIREAWDSLTLDEINTLVQSMSHRVAAVLTSKGHATHY